MLNRSTLTAAFAILMHVMSFLQRWLVAMARVRKAYRALRAKRAERKQRVSRPLAHRRRGAVRRELRPVPVDGN